MSPPAEIRFTVPGKPVAKGRPRSRIVTPSGGKPFVTLYTPKKTESEEGAIRHFASLAMAGRPLMDGPLEMSFCAYMPIMDSWSKAKKADALAGRIFPAGKIDIDNAAKIVMDALNNVCYRDDAQIVTAHLYKRFSENPRVSVVIREKV